MNKNEIKNLINNTSPVIFEVGAADGGDTEDFVNVFSDTDVKMYCFEPEPTNIEKFKSRNFGKDVFLFEGAVGNYTGRVDFNRSRDKYNEDSLRYSGSINKPKEHLNEWDFIIFDENLDCRITTLDNFCEENKINNIDFIWADVQGAEDKMLLGAKKTLKKTRYLYTEYSNKEYYEGQKNLQQILELLGEDWQLLEDFGADILLKNKNL